MTQTLLFQKSKERMQSQVIFLPKHFAMLFGSKNKQEIPKIQNFISFAISHVTFYNQRESFTNREDIKQNAEASLAWTSANLPIQLSALVKHRGHER